MADDIKKVQKDINRKIDDAYNRLEELESEDDKLAEELQQLNKQRHRYHVLSELSDQLEKLEKLDGAELFWGENYDRSSAQNEQKRIRNLVINYDSHVSELQKKQATREELVESLTAKINVLNEDTMNLQARKEARAEEFIIEREMTEMPYRPMNMPWNGDDEDHKQFRKILLIVLLFSILLGILIPMWDIPIPDRVEVVEIPERLAQLMVKKQPPPPPPKAQEKKEEEKKPDKKEKKEKKPEPEKVKKARKKAERSGLMAFKDDFADLIDDTPIAKL
ncbi:MAG: hypothetical protein KAT12_08945, partial [Gammaproteobacteria bacterium]|nr:hypothetical protein [Gammaproteobacteria bacterium]